MPLVAQIGIAVVTIAVAGVVVAAVRRKAAKVPVVVGTSPATPAGAQVFDRRDPRDA